MNTVISRHHGTDRLDRNRQTDEVIIQNTRLNRQHDGAERTNLFRRDTYDSVPGIEHYNNYTK